MLHKIKFIYIFEYLFIKVIRLVKSSPPPLNASLEGVFYGNTTFAFVADPTYTPFGLELVKIAG